MLKKDFRKLIESIQIEENTTMEKMSAKIGRSEGYLTQLLSRKKKDGDIILDDEIKIPEATVKQVKTTFLIPKTYDSILPSSIAEEEEEEFETKQEQINRHLTEIDVLLEKIRWLNGNNSNRNGDYKKKKRS